MKLLKKNTVILESERLTTDFDHWNSIQNRYESKSEKGTKYPKSLIAAAIERFNEEAESYHIDSSKFPYVRVCGMDCIWQVDFHCDKNPCGPHFKIYEIYFNSKTRKIMQACFSN